MRQNQARIINNPNVLSPNLARAMDGAQLNYEQQRFRRENPTASSGAPSPEVDCCFTGGIVIFNLGLIGAGIGLITYGAQNYQSDPAWIAGIVLGIIPLLVGTYVLGRLFKESQAYESIRQTLGLPASPQTQSTPSIA